MKVNILRSGHNPKFLRRNDAKIVSDRIAESCPVSWDFFAQEAEGGIGKFGAGGIAFVVGAERVNDFETAGLAI